MHSDWFSEIEILQARWQHGEKVGYGYHSRLEKTLCKWEIYDPLVTKGLTKTSILLDTLVIFCRIRSCLFISDGTKIKVLCINNVNCSK
jgi:hypothetical protein